MNRWTATLTLVLAALSPAKDALAQDAVPTPFGHNYGENETARTAAFAGAARALGAGTSGVLLNPAAIALTRLYHVEGILQTTPEAGRLMAGGVIIDSIMNRYRLAGGLSVLAGFNDAGPADWSTLDVRVALAFPISDKIHIGVAPRYASITHALPAAEGDKSQDDVAELSLHAFTLDAGVTLRPTDSFHIALVGQNVVSNRRGTFPIQLGGGVGFATRTFSVEVDGLADLDSYEAVTTRLMGGGEVFVTEQFPIRLGYRFDQGADLHAIAAGLGYVGREFSIEASLRRTLSDRGATTIVVGLAYHVESAGFMRAAREGYGE